MLPFLAFCLQAAAAGQAAPENEVLGRVAGSALVVRLEVPGFTRDDKTAKLLQKALGPRGVVVGAIPSELVMLEVVVDPESGKHLSDAEWRDMNLQGSGNDWKYFATGGFLCGEVAILIEGSGSHDFHAFAVRGGHRFDLHLSESLSSARGPTVPRERFERLVAGVRLGLVRLGTWAQMPPAALELMDAALRRTVDWKAWLAEQEKAREGDYAVPFATGELLRFLGGKPGEQAGAYARAVRLLESRKEPTAPDRLAHAASEDGLALALLDDGQAEKALPHLEAAAKVAENLTAPVRAALAYDLARVHARLAHADLAISLLKKSESEAPGALGRAKTEKEFEALRGTKAFQDLLNGDRGNQ